MKQKISTLIVVFLFFATFAFAHPPKSVVLSYDSGAKILSIEIEHRTYDFTEHFIHRIVVQKNDEEPFVLRYNRQDSSSIFTKEVELDAERGDTIQVKAYCNEGGTRTETLVIE